MQRIAVFLLALAGASGATPASAQDASFGCKVLLCAAASQPGWASIPYCVPVMHALFRDLARGRAFPICPEGGGGRLGHEPFLPCPAGTVPATSSRDDPLTVVPRTTGDLCADLSRPRWICGDANGGSGCRRTYPATPRGRRAEPDFVDITTPNGVQRLYFALRDYR